MHVTVVNRCAFATPHSRSDSGRSSRLFPDIEHALPPGYQRPATTIIAPQLRCFVLQLSLALKKKPGQIRHTTKGRFLIMPLTLKSSCRGAYHDAISCGFHRRQPVQGTDQNKGWRGTAG